MHKDLSPDAHVSRHHKPTRTHYTTAYRLCSLYFQVNLLCRAEKEDVLRPHIAEGLEALLGLQGGEAWRVWEEGRRRRGEKKGNHREGVCTAWFVVFNKSVICDHWQKRSCS